MTVDLAAHSQRSFAFGPFVLIPERRLLLTGDAPVRVGGRALDILAALVERPGKVVDKRELLARVWPDAVVEEGNLKVNMAALRRALGEGPGSAPYIATVVGRGYRFVADVRASSSTDLPPHVDGPSSSHGHNLPTGTTRIVGRAAEIDAICAALKTSRIVTIVGAGGIGKTTVALAVAERAIGSLKDGVWLVDLAPLKDASLVAAAIAMAVGLTAHSANMLAALSDYLRKREMLLVLDSCEHIIDAIAACADRVLMDAPGVKILASSREPLRVKGERVRRLPGLETPPVTARPSAKDALTFPAVQLFVDRATERLESFELNDADAVAASEICRRLDGVALAIELAATRVDAFGVGGLLDNLDHRFRLLKGRRAGPERHRTLMATLDWSYDLLSEGERAVLRRLSTFAGAFDLRSACAVAIDESSERASVVYDLASLVAKSFVATEAREIEMEYRLLDTTRAYALEKLAESAELGSARQRHAEYFLGLADAASTDGERSPRTEWLARYGARIDDIRDALRWAFGDAGDISLGVRLTVTAIPFWERLYLMEECREAAELALDDRFAAHRNEREEAALYVALGATWLYTRGPVIGVKSALTKALEIGERTQETSVQLECLRGLSEYELWTGDTHASIALAERLRALAVANGDTATGANADAPTGSALRYLGDLGASQSHLEKTLYRRPAGGGWQASRFEFDQRVAALGSLATVLWLRGLPDQAVAMSRRQLEEAEASHYAVSLCSAMLHTNVGVALFVRDVEEAGRMLDVIERHTAEHRLTLWAAMAVCMRGRYLVDAGEPFRVAEFRNAVAELYEGGLRMRYPSYLANLADGLAQQGEFDDAHANIDKAIALSKNGGQPWGIPEILRMKGNIVRAEGRRGAREAAVGHYLESIEWARRQGALSWELRTAVSFVELGRERETGGDERAEAMLSSAYARFTEGFATGDLQRARSLLGTRNAQGV